MRYLIYMINDIIDTGYTYLMVRTDNGTCFIDKETFDISTSDDIINIVNTKLSQRIKQDSKVLEDDRKAKIDVLKGMKK